MGDESRFARRDETYARRSAGPAPVPVCRRLFEELAAEFAGQLPPAAVVGSIATARRALRWFGETPEDMPRLWKNLARADLQQLSARQESGARVYGVQRSRRCAGP